MARTRSPLRTRVDHSAAAAAARQAPGTWVVAGIYPTRSSADGIARNARAGRIDHYRPAGSFEARTRLVEDGGALEVRYAGPVPAVRPEPVPAPRTRAGSRTDAAPSARLVLTGGPSDPAWHAVRRGGLGGSDIAALLGLSRARGARHVYEAKHGRDDYVTETREMRMGQVMEPVIAELFAEDTGLRVEDAPGTLVNVARPWMIGNVDRYVIDSSGRVVAPLECKQRGHHQAQYWDEGPPDAVAIQAIWYMAVGGWSHAHVAGLIGGVQLATFRLERDEELIGELIEHCGAWWQRHIVDGFPPPADGLDATAKLLGRLWETTAEQTAEVDLARAVELRSRHRELTARAKAVEEELTAVENEMRLLSESAEIVKAGGQPAWTWKQNGTFRSKAFAKEHPELAAQYTRPADVLDTKALAADHPDTYRRYRARTLRVPAKGA